MPLAALENLARIGQLKHEPPNVAECRRLLTMARLRLDDAAIINISVEGRFSSAYTAAHAAAVAALRWHGYRSENRFTVFQCLTHTVGWPSSRWRVFDLAHQKRNLAEYEGYVDVEESLISELCEMARALIADVGSKIEGGGCDVEN